MGTTKHAILNNWTAWRYVHIDMFHGLWICSTMYHGLGLDQYDVRLEIWHTYSLPTRALWARRGPATRSDRTNRWNSRRGLWKCFDRRLSLFSLSLSFSPFLSLSILSLSHGFCKKKAEKNSQSVQRLQSVQPTARDVLHTIVREIEGEETVRAKEHAWKFRDFWLKINQTHFIGWHWRSHINVRNKIKILW